VKVLDFGLAKLAQPGDANRTAGSGHELAQSPTITTPAMTQMGLILGTAAYMAPEQARGRLVDKRADIWAFGALLFEMLTGRRAFEGDDLSITLATVMMKDPDWGSMPPAIPSGLQRLVRRCLVKDPRQRIRDMGDVRLALEGVLDAEPDSAAVGQPGPAATAAPQAQRSSLLRRVATLAAVAVVASGVAGTIVWLAARPLPPRVSRTTITMSGPSAMTISGASRDVAITPDGSRVVYVGNNSTQIYVRALDSLEPVAVASGVPARSPFVSPDGQWVGFFDGGLLLKKVAISGGPPITLARLDGAVGRGGAWLVDDTIVFASANPVNGLMSVPAGGGEPKVLTTPDGSRVESDHLFPEALPGSRAVLFTITAQTGGPDAAAVAVYDLDTNTQTIVVRGGSHAQFVPAPAGPLGRRGRAGHLVYVASGTLRAVPFDPDRLAVLGPAVPVVPRMFAASTGAGVYAVSTNGTLVYADAPLGSLIGLNRLLA
jgi:serine/threonine-protein kinase